MLDSRITQKTGIVYDPIYLEHRPRRGHPESPERLVAILKGIEAAVPEDRWIKLKPRTASIEELALCHSTAYIERVREEVLGDEPCLSTGDTEIGLRSFEVACYAVGGVLTAADAVMDGTVRNAFCAVRPPGHHATTDRGMGFCIFNNVAIAARYLQKRHGLERILIADWDVHHGNGTQAIFYDDPTVFYFSTHEWPLYPGTGAAWESGIGQGRGFTLNCPCPAGSGRAEIVGAFLEKLVPAMKTFRPQFVLVSAGFDARTGDGLGHCCLTDADFEELTRIVLQIATEHADGRLVSSLEGGYNLEGLASAAGAHVAVLAGS